MTMTITKNVSGRKLSTRSDLNSSDMSKLFYDANGCLFLIIEDTQFSYSPARVRDDYLDADCEPRYPLEMAPVGTSVSFTN